MGDRAGTMLEIIHLQPEDARDVPWKNGGGRTREFALWPEDASFEEGDFAWRLSSASVNEAGPFSALPGIERILVVTVGAGLELSHGDLAPRARLRRLEPYRFAGDWPTTAALPDGPIADFNVMLDPERARASVEALLLGRRRSRLALAEGHAFVHVLAGRCDVRVTGEEEAFELDAGDSLWLRELRGGEELDCAGGTDACELLIVELGAR